MTTDYLQQAKIPTEEFAGHEIPVLGSLPDDAPWIYSCSRCINTGTVGNEGHAAFLFDPQTKYAICRVCWTPHKPTSKQKQLFAKEV